MSGTATRGPMPTGTDGEGFHAVAFEEQVREGAGRTVDVSGHNVAVFRVGGQLYAIDDACTHEDGPLAEGDLEGTIVTCPYHNWRFDISTGDCINQAERPVSCFAIRQVDGIIWVGSQTREGTRDRGGEHDDVQARRLRGEP